MQIQLLPDLFLLFSAFYIGIILLIIWGLRRLQIKTCTAQPMISVVIAARNEARRIRPTLESLTRLEYPKERYEIILVDDASEDDTAKIIQNYTERFSNWKLIRLSEKSSKLRGKKKALLEAVRAATGELIFTTDADCVVPPGWLRTMNCYFEEDVQMVLGNSPLTTAKGFWGTFLNFDNLFSAIVTAAPAKLGFPHTSIGRNLAYRKTAYENVGGYATLKKFRSGDDVHLTEQFRRKKQGKVDYCAHPDSFVYAMPPETGREIFYQQIRKNSKTLKKSLPTVLFSILVFAAYLLFIFLPLLAPPLLTLWLIVMALKMGVEFWALTQAAFVFRRKELIPWFPLMQVIYPVYVIVFSILGALQLYKWKP